MYPFIKDIHVYGCLWIKYFKQKSWISLYKAIELVGAANHTLIARRGNVGKKFRKIFKTTSNICENTNAAAKIRFITYSTLEYTDFNSIKDYRSNFESSLDDSRDIGVDEIQLFPNALTSEVPKIHSKFCLFNLESQSIP